MHGYDPEYVRNNYTSRALEKAAVVFDACYLEGFNVFSTNGSTQYIFVFDLGAVPANGTPPVGPVLAVGASGSSAFLYMPPRVMQTGIVVANSTSATSFTAGAADCWFDVQYAVSYPD